MTLIITKLAVFGACIAAVAAFGVDNVAPWAGVLAILTFILK